MYTILLKNNSKNIDKNIITSTWIIGFGIKISLFSVWAKGFAANDIFVNKNKLNAVNIFFNIITPLE